jgi:hypothetical protein
MQKKEKKRRLQPLQRIFLGMFFFKSSKELGFYIEFIGFKRLVLAYHQTTPRL